MDLGLKGKSAIVCASSRGLGKACAISLAREGVNVVINGRDDEALAQTAKEIEALDAGTVTIVKGDMNDAATRDALLAACPEPDILVNNNGGPPPGLFAQWEEDDWQAALSSNLIAPLMMIKAVIDGMQDRKFGRIINITSAMVKAPNVFMGLSTTARSGLTAMSKGLSGAVVQNNVTINNLLPERFDTDRQKQMAELAVAMRGITMEEAREEIAQTINAKRMGDPHEFGDTCAFLCSAQAGYISGQNLQLDGGTYPGLI